MLRLFFSLAVLTACLTSQASWGSEVYVDAAASPPGDGSATAPFVLLADAMAAASHGDVVRLAAGRYVQSTPIVVNGMTRAAVLVLKTGVTVEGSGDQTVLVAPGEDVVTYGITAASVQDAIVRDLRVEGPCVHGVNLRGSRVTLERVTVVNDATGLSSAAMDAREGSFPTATDCVFDGGHVALLVEFEGGGSFDNCRIGRRQRETLIVIDSVPEFRNCNIEGGGRDTLVLTQGSVPVFSGCEIGRGDRWTVRVVGYPSGSVLDLSGNRWFTSDVQALRQATLDAEDDPVLGARVQFLPLAPPVALVPSTWGAMRQRFEAGRSRP